MKSIICD